MLAEQILYLRDWHVQTISSRHSFTGESFAHMLQSSCKYFDCSKHAVHSFELAPKYCACRCCVQSKHLIVAHGVFVDGTFHALHIYGICIIICAGILKVLHMRRKQASLALSESVGNRINTKPAGHSTTSSRAGLVKLMKL